MVGLAFFFGTKPALGKSTAAIGNISNEIRNVELHDSANNKSTINQLVSGNSVIVVVAHGADCPIMRKNAESFLALKKSYPQVSFIFVNGNPRDDSQIITKDEAEYFNGAHIWRNRDQNVLKALDLKTVGQAVVIVPTKKLEDWPIVFSGGISDRVNFDISLPQAKQNFLRAAIDSGLAKSDVKVPRAPVFGCAITFTN